MGNWALSFRDERGGVVVFAAFTCEKSKIAGGVKYPQTKKEMKCLKNGRPGKKTKKIEGLTYHRGGGPKCGTKSEKEKNGSHLTPQTGKENRKRRLKKKSNRNHAPEE